MESKLTRLYDLKKAINEWQWATSANENAIQETVYQVELKYKKYEFQEEVWKEDIVTVAMRSAVKKFNRTTKIRVGCGLFDKDFEEQLIGKKVGEEYSYLHDSVEVRYIVQDSCRLIVPFITDVMVQAENIENIFTVGDFYRYLRLQDVADSVYNQSYEFIEHYVNLCDYQIAEEDVDYMEELEMQRCRKISAEQGFVFDDMTKEELLGAVGCSTLSDFKEMIRKLFTKELKVALIEKKEEELKNFEDVLTAYTSVLESVRKIVMENYKKEVS